MKEVGGRKEEKEKTKIAGLLCICLADDDPEAWCPELKFIIDSDGFLGEKVLIQK